MGIAVLLGLAALIAALMMLRWYATVHVKTIKKGLAWIGIGLLALVVVFLAVTGRMGAALAALAGLMVWAGRILNIVQMGRQFRGAFSGRGKDPHASTASSLTAEEAYRVLGLAPGATEDEIKAAHRRLIEQIHPDRGGSDYLAAKVNLAKDFLLKTQGRS